MASLFFFFSNHDCYCKTHFFSFFCDTPHCSILKIPAALHYPVSPFVSKVVKGVSISFLLLSKKLSRVSSSLFTLIMRYWQRCRFKALIGLNWSLSTLQLITLNIWQTLLSFTHPVSNGDVWRKKNPSFIPPFCHQNNSELLSTWSFTGNQPCFQVNFNIVSVCCSTQIAGRHLFV